jgi:hypothetical protein
MSSQVSPTIAALVTAGEGQTIEFKDERTKPSNLAETLVAFANTDGGILVIGVSDDRSIKGVTDPKVAIDNALIAASRECSDPPVVLGSIRRASLSPSKAIIVVRVPKATTSVHSAQGRFFKREGSRNVALTAAAVRQLFATRDGFSSLLPERHGPIYEVLDHQFKLTLRDAQGKQAVLERREQVRFLQDNVVALYDQAWGDGQIFVGYRVKPGRIADRIKVGSRYRTLISLRETKHRGDLLTYRIRRRIVDGFTTENEWHEVDVDHPTRQLGVTIVFPTDRPCKQASIVRATTGQHTPLTDQNLRVSRSGHQVLTWSIKKPLLGERYALHWNW